MLKKRSTTGILCYVFLVTVSQGITVAQELTWDVLSALDFAEAQLTKTVETIKASESTTLIHPGNSSFDYTTWTATSRVPWTSGFFSGCLWHMYEWTSDPCMLADAVAWTETLEEQKNYTSNHDIGFQLMTSFGNGYALTENPTYKDIILTGAETLALRYDDTIGMMRSWSWGDWAVDNKFTVIVDNVMNLELLLFSAANGGPQAHYDIAVSHALKTIEHFVREDGSTFHVVIFDETTGELRETTTHQGCAVETTWSRGQAWALNGFTMMYRYTQDPVFLQTALQLADYFIGQLPDDFVPTSDFDCGGSKDTSAAAIAAAGLLELGGYVANPIYTQAGHNILSALTSPDFLATSESAPILRRACRRYGDDEQGVIYADYYFMTAMMQYIRKASNPSAGNFNRDADTDLVDLLELVRHWMTSETCDPFNRWCSFTDLNNDADVNLEDVGVFSRAWMGGN